MGFLKRWVLNHKSLLGIACGVATPFVFAANPAAGVVMGAACAAAFKDSYTQGKAIGAVVKPVVDELKK